jgi:alkylation response protein AidB-like acyl-CoA dehydrogenase
LVEGDADARAILAESGRVADGPTTYGVWAARSPEAELRAEPEPGGWRLTGTKAFCSGSGVLDRALVTAEAPDGYRLFDVATDEVAAAPVPGSWPAVGMADSLSETLEFGGASVPPDSAVGPPGFYTDRPGFWFGACGVAACWYGGALGLVGGVMRTLDPDPGDLVLAELGRQSAGLWAMRTLLAEVAASIDADPRDRAGRARERALMLRQVVHRGCAAILRSTSDVGGARPLCHDARQARLAADLHVYLAQHHGGPDALHLGTSALGNRGWI